VALIAPAKSQAFPTLQSTLHDLMSRDNEVLKQYQ